MKNKLKSLLIIFSFFSLQMTAQEKKTLSLNEAIDLGLQNSKLLKINQAKIEEATAAAKEAVEKKLRSRGGSCAASSLTHMNRHTQQPRRKTKTENKLNKTNI